MEEATPKNMTFAILEGIQSEMQRETLPSSNFQPVLPLLVVIDGKNTVTNDASGPNRFYRLHKP